MYNLYKHIYKTHTHTHTHTHNNSNIKDIHIKQSDTLVFEQQFEFFSIL